MTLRIHQEHVQRLGEHHETFCRNTPFPHIVLDNFLKEEEAVVDNHNNSFRLDDVVAEIRGIPNSEYDFNEHAEVQIKKRGLSDPSKMPPLTRRVVDFFTSDTIIQYLERLTGITGLMPDPSLMGGGVHKTDPGGHLAIHADFNIHPMTGFHRRLNLLLFLNPEWDDEEWGGLLELWDREMTSCVVSVSPLLNRAVVFRITDDAFHGHPDPLRSPEGVSRYSLAFYYYTADRPPSEKSPFHWATWKRRPNGGF